MEIKYRTQFGELLAQLGLSGHAVEIGVAEGRNAEVLIQHPAITKLYMVDAWQTLNQAGDGGYNQEWHDRNWIEAHERVKPWSDKAVFLRGMSSEMIDKIPDDSLIFGYIDGDHSHRGCMTDLINIFPKIKTGGIIACHDFLNLSYGVNAAVFEFVIWNKYSPTDDVHVTDEDGDQSMVSCWFIKK